MLRQSIQLSNTHSHRHSHSHHFTHYLQSVTVSLSHSLTHSLTHSQPHSLSFCRRCCWFERSSSSVPPSVEVPSFAVQCAVTVTANSGHWLTPSRRYVHACVADGWTDSLAVDQATRRTSCSHSCSYHVARGGVSSRCPTRWLI